MKRALAIVITCYFGSFCFISFQLVVLLFVSSYMYLLKYFLFCVFYHRQLKTGLCAWKFWCGIVFGWKKNRLRVLHSVYLVKLLIDYKNEWNECDFLSLYLSLCKKKKKKEKNGKNTVNNSTLIHWWGAVTYYLSLENWYVQPFNVKRIAHFSRRSSKY